LVASFFPARLDVVRNEGCVISQKPQDREIVGNFLAYFIDNIFL